MKTHSLSIALLSLAALTTTLSACSSPSTAGASSRARTPSLAFSTQSDSPVDLSGTWGFVLAASDVAAPIQRECADKSGHDITKATACWNEIAHEAALEKIRFGTDAAGRTLWTSFGAEGSSELVFLEAPVELTAEGPGHVVGKVVGPATGKQAEDFAKSGPHSMRIDVVDARTIVINDPSKGRLVYSKE